MSNGTWLMLPLGEPNRDWFPQETISKSGAARFPEETNGCGFQKWNLHVSNGVESGLIFPAEKSDPTAKDGRV